MILRPLSTHLPLLLLPALAAGALFGVRSAAAQGQGGSSEMQRTLHEVRDNLDGYERRVEALAARYEAKAPEGPSVYRLQSRINDGLVFFQLGDYERASFLLMEVVQDQVNQSYIGYKDAVFYLAESLYQLHNPIGAAGFYQVVVDKGYRQYRKDALLRLVEICFITNQLDSVERYFGQLGSEPGASTDPQVVYVHAKSLYFRKEYDRALQEFAIISRGSPYFHRARYFLGTIQVLQGRLPDAVVSFQQVAAEPVASDRPDAKEAEQVRQLAHLALGRIYYDLGQLPESVAEYTTIPRDSAQFDRALYEICWTYIKKGEHNQALRALDIMLLASPESTLAPEATLLKGNLQLKLNKYAEAQSTFQEIVDRFGPVREQLAKVLKEHADPETYFQQLIGKNLDRFAVQTAIPPLAATWVREEEDLIHALAVVQDVDGAKEDLAEAEELISQLEDALAAENRIEIFPEMYQAWKSMLESESALLVLKQRLLEEERRLIWGSATPEERNRYQTIAGQRAELERKFQEIPHTTQGMARREAQVEGVLDGLERQAFRLGIDLDALKAQLVAMDKWIADTAARRGGQTAGRERVRASVLEQQQQLAALEEEMQALKRAIARQKSSVGVADTVGSAEAAIKREYDRTLSEEAALLQTLRRRLSPEQQRLIDEEDGLRQRIGRLEEKIHRFYANVRQQVDEKVHALRAQVLEEKKAVARYGRQVTGYKGMGENLAGKVTAASLQDVQKKFRGIVLQADVGIIDVAWQKKEERRKAYLELARERKAELEELDGEFKAVLEEKP